jgi:hypothetical protein
MNHFISRSSMQRVVNTRAAVLTLCVGLASCATSGPEQATSTDPGPKSSAHASVTGIGTALNRASDPVMQSAYPETFVRTITDGQRFQDPGYFGLMAANGIQSVDQRALFSRLQAAVAANERYKALYFARVLTNVKPEIAAGWNNRASLASALGLADEATASQANAKDPAHAGPVPLGLLPGSGLSAKPVSLGDWAAAMALLSDGIAAREGPKALMAVKDSVSGIHNATQREIADEAAEAREYGVSPSGPWARPEAVKLQDVLPNAFSLRTGEPMQSRNVDGLGMTFALLGAGLAGFQMNINAAAAEQTLKASNLIAGQATSVPSHYKGGVYTTVSYTQGKDVVTTNHPQPSGEYDVVGLPVPLWWASGGSLTPAIKAQWKSTDTVVTARITAADLKSGHSIRAKELRLPEGLYFPKLITLCEGRVDREGCSRPATLMELMLTNGDVQAIAPGATANFVEQSFLERAYLQDRLILVSANSDRYNEKGSRSLAGYDKDGVLYCPSVAVSGINPTAWLLPAR